jgi:bZIP transcription factor
MMTSVSEHPKRKFEDDEAQSSLESDPKAMKTVDGLRLLKRGPISKAREIRLEQNRKAARESRRRKKVMIEELQRSVIFFSRSNGVLKQQNDDLQRLVMNAQAQVGQIEGQQANSSAAAHPTSHVKEENQQQQAEANTVAAQAVFESQGFPAAAARAAAQTMNGTSSPAKTSTTDKSSAASSQSLPPMQPGATMQAMANFQQAAAVAMQQAVQGMQQIPGISVSALSAATPAGANSSQAYNDTMTALAMQQAAAGNPSFVFQQGGFMPMLSWQQEKAHSQPTPAAHQ